MKLKSVAIAATALTLAGGLASCSSSSDSGSAAASSSPTSATFTVDDPASYYPGTWKGNDHVTMTETGERSSGSQTLIIDSIKDNIFEATRIVELGIPADFGQGKKTPTATVKAPGVVNPDNSLTIVKVGGPGEFNVWPVDQNTLDYTYTQSGETAYAARGSLTRQ